MDFDNFLNNLDSDIERQLSESLNIPTISNSSSAIPTDDKWTFCPECGTRNESGSSFCCECGTPIENDDSVNNCHFNGIIMTDTSLLADKYSTTKENVVSTILDFIEESKEHNINWAFLDLSHLNIIKDRDEWGNHSKALDKFMLKNGISPSPSLSLFIIGGHDVVPQPTSENPSGGSDEYDSTVFSDFFYSFNSEMPLDFLDYNKARCNVGRLPLETGKLNSSFDEDIKAYLNRSIECMAEGGISIGKAVMTTNADWIPASREMSRNLPAPHLDNENGVTLDNMFISPQILAEMPDELANKYNEAIRDADMLVFNLHGACDPEASGFYSNDLAFSIDTLKNIGAKIFNTVACWGGRYIRYERKDSMLLNAIYNHDVLLYSGSCVPALGKCGHFNYDDTWRIQPAAYSETFMARFCEYQCIGKLNAGEAFLKAKCDYYNTSRLVEDDEHILSTVLMFNLYGNPALTTVPDMDALRDLQEPTGIKEVKLPFRKMKREVVMKKAKNEITPSILDSIRDSVNKNINSIHESITQSLYNMLGIEPRQLSLVEHYETIGNNGEKLTGYLYNYDIQNNKISSRVIAKIDTQGKIISLIQTK